MLHALQPKKHLTPAEKAEDDKVYLQGTPDSLASVPGKYSDIERFEAENQLRAKRMQSKQQGGPDQIGSVREISDDAINKYNAGNASNAGGSQYNSRLMNEEKELLAARKSAIAFPVGQTLQSRTDWQSSSGGLVNRGITGADTGSGREGTPEILAGSGEQESSREDQNFQTEKRKFLTDQKKDKEAYIKHALQKPLSPYELKAGSIIPGVMITGINSDLPGGIIGQVRENVYDTVTGHYLLVPQGTRVIGEYDSKVAYAQERVLIVWSRMIFPNGQSINLEGMDGVDLSGYAGLSDKVNNHYMKLLGGVVLSTLLSTGAKVSAGNYNAGQADIGQLAASGPAEEANRAGSKLVEKNLDVQPTLEIRPGFKFNVFVNKDIILRPYKS